MGKLGPRLSSRKKAKRWRKGQSASSNPETTKHREQATGMFFREFSGTPGLTVEDLKKHDAIHGIEPQLEKLGLNDKEESNIDESTIDGTINTFDSFASIYSNCSNVSFSRFLAHFQSNSALHKEMLAVLAAVTEVIQQNGGNETPTEYFAALMSTLEAVDNDMSTAATLSLLCMGLKAVPKNVLNAQFGTATQLLLQILTKYASNDNFLILRHCIRGLTIFLREQEIAAWSSSSTVQILNALLSFTTHSKPKVRKTAQHGICAIIRGSDIMKGDNPPVYHPAAPEVAKHCTAQLNAACEPGGITSVLHTLMLLKEVAHQLPKSYVKTICEGLLRIMGLKNALVTSCCLQTLYGLFNSKPSEAILPSQRNAQIIAALYDYQPSASDAQPTLAWLAVMQEAHCNLSRNNLNLSAANIIHMLEKCIALWLSDKPEVISGTSNTIKTLLQECVSPLCENEEQAKKYSTVLDQIITMMHKALSYQYLEAWHHILHLIALLFQITGKTGNRRLFDIIRSLAELHDSHNFPYVTDAEYAVGAAVRAMGPDVVLQILPLRVDNVINLQRGWLIPLLKDCINHGSIAFFMEYLFPIVTMCEKKAKEPISGRTYGFLIPQIWAVLPSICNNASDVKGYFKNIAKILGVAISDKKDLRTSSMTALRKLITRAVEDNNEEDKAELGRFAKNYLPIFFNIYTTKSNGTDEEGQRLAAFETIKTYLTITDTNLINELFDRALSKLKEPGATDFLKESVYDLIRILTQYTDSERLKIFYDICVPLFEDTKKQKEQKKAYRFLEEILGSEKDVCKEFVLQHRREIQKIFISSATTVIKTSKGARLRCLTHFVKVHPHLEKSKFLQAIIPETILCVKEINKRCRDTAYQLLNVIAEKFLGNSEHLKNYTNMLMVGLAGDQKYCSASLLALASVTYSYNGSLGIDTVREILGHACTILYSPTRETVESAISYIKVYIGVMPSPIIGPTLPNIVESLSRMNDDCKRHFRQEIRDLFAKLIQKYGFEVIKGMVPNSDVILHKRLKNIHKVQEMKKKNRKLKKRSKKTDDLEDDYEFSVKRRPKSIEDILADSEDELDEDEDSPRNKKRTSRKEAWIQENEENIVDLIDPAAARNITTTRPGKSPMAARVPAKTQKDHGFKTAPDGRLIITDDNKKGDDDSDLDIVKRKKRIISDFRSDSEDDYEDEDDDIKSVTTAKSVSRKRKYSESIAGSSVRSQPLSKYKAGGSGIHRPLKMGKTEQHTLGSEFRARKAGGDIKKKGKPEPYAYVPLTRSVLNKRKKKKNAGKFNSVISGARKGARIGSKNRRRE